MTLKRELVNDANFGSIISVVGKSTLEMMGLFHADKKFHMTYNEKRQNNSLESIIWNTLRIPQN